MNTKSLLNVLAVVVSIAVLAATNGFSAVQATETIFQYGTIAQEDESYAVHNGNVYLNTVYEDNSGNFRIISDLETEYTVDEALDRFYPMIQEDTNSFVHETDFSTVGLVFMFNDETLTFQLLGAMDLS